MLINIYSIGLLGVSLEVVSLIAIIIGGIAFGALGGTLVYRLIVVKKFNKAKTTADNIIKEAQQNAKTIQKEAMLSAQEEVLRLKNDTENELKIRRAEIDKLNDRYMQREEFINRKEQSLDKRSESLEEYKQNLVAKENELALQYTQVNNERQKVVQQLEKVAKLTTEEAKSQLIAQISDEAKLEAANQLKDIEQRLKDDAKKIATDIIGQSIQKYSADVTSEATVATVSLPNDDMKGRLIGREGRNIKAIENATGVDLIIDDTPEAIVLSCFDPVRREVARIAIQKLMQDGRIHPARIEETVKKVEKDIDQDIKEAGESTLLELGINGLHPELVKILGRLKYRTSYGQNVLKHSMEVASIAAKMAAELGCDEQTAKRGGLLHDIGKAVDYLQEGTHVSIGVELAKKYHENDKVINCIEAHHGDVDFLCTEAILVQAADVISSARPGARRESLDNYVKRLEKLESICNGFKGVEKSFAIQAGREVRIIVKPEVITDEQAIILARDIAQKIQNEMEYPGQIKVNVIRESRAIDYAK
ncbi:MAG: ribonuclease Y [Clostridia bacterium]|nr:ribonuclease Y [Clostridia bacterium]